MRWIWPRDSTSRYASCAPGNSKTLEYLANPANRCYFCKHELFTELAPLAKAEGFAVIAYGENASDVGDFRPGAQAAAEFQVRAPLKEAGLTKADIRQLSAQLGLLTKTEIRQLSAELGLPTAEKPQICQRRTGTLAGSGAIFEKSEGAIEGDRKVFERDGQEGRKVRFHFCPSCGTSLYWDGDFRPGWCVIAVGAFADPTFPPPSVSVFEEFEACLASASRWNEACSTWARLVGGKGRWRAA